VLGLIVLVGVLGFAGWQWVRQNHLQDEYAAGIQAGQRQDWDAARAHFAAASGYLDADRRAQDVATTIAERDNLYNNALAYENAGNWSACLDSIKQVIAIESGYKDSAQIQTLATNQLYSDALSGTVVLRTQASPPGLYFYDGVSDKGAGWVWLPKSDLQSRIQGTGRGDWLVYDVPGDRNSSGTTSPPDSFSGSPQLRGRSLMAARRTVPIQAQALSIEPDLYDSFEWGRDGVWAVSTARNSLGRRVPIVSLSAPTDMTAVYEGYESPITRTVNLDSVKDNAYIMDLDPNSDRYLAATWSGVDALGTVTKETVTNLYLAGVNGDRKLLYTITGGSFMSAQFSPDGLHAVLNTYSPIDARTEELTVVLLSLDGTSKPQVIADTSTSAGTQAANQIDPNSGLLYSIFFTLSAAFIYDGPYAGDVVVAERDSGQYNLRVIDTTRGSSLILTEVPTQFPLIWSIFEGSDGDVVMVAREDYFGTDLTRIYTIPVIFVELAPNVAPKVTRLLVDWDFYHTALNYATIAGGRLFFSTLVCCDNQTTTSLFTFPVESFGAQRVRPSAMSSEVWPATADLLNYTGQSFGPSFYGYLADGDLHVRAYDGSTDLTVDHQVTYLDDPSLHRPGDDRLH
jgi:hypothetical protein